MMYHVYLFRVVYGHDLQELYYSFIKDKLMYKEFLSIYSFVYTLLCHCVVEDGGIDIVLLMRLWLAVWI